MMGRSKVAAHWPREKKLHWKGTMNVLNNVPKNCMEVMIIIEFLEVKKALASVGEKRPREVEDAVLETTLTDLTEADESEYEPPKSVKEIVKVIQTEQEAEKKVPDMSPAKIRK